MYLSCRQLAISAACIVLGACSSPRTTPSTPDADAGEIPTDAGTVSCESEPNLDTYVANLTKPGKAGLSFILVSSDPAPPSRGLNTWSLKITDTSGNPVDGANVEIKPFMPQHGHGSSLTPTVNAAGGGTYTIGSVYLFMPGLWTITITAKATVTDSAVFTFCIPG